MFDNARRMTNDDGRQRIAIGHLSVSGDLKNVSAFDRKYELLATVKRYPLDALYSRRLLLANYPSMLLINIRDNSELTCKIFAICVHKI